MLLIPLTVACPLLVAAGLALFGEHAKRRLADAAAILVALFVAFACAWLALASRAAPLVYWFGGWIPRSGVALGVSFVVDPIGAGLAALSALLVTAALVFSLRWFDSVGALFHTLMLTFLAALVGFALTGDLFDLFVFFELMSASAFALSGYKSDEAGPLQGALNFAVTNTLGAFFVLTGLALMYARTGALNLAQIARATGATHDALVVVAAALVCSGFLVKAAAVPFHFWLADAHAVAPTPVSVVFSGVMVTAGVYAVARLEATVFAGAVAAHEGHARALLVGAGVATAVVGAAMCFAQRHLKRMLAFSTIAHLGIMVMGVGLLSTAGLAGAAVYAAGHGLVKGALFMAVGIVLHRQRSVDEVRLRGRGEKAIAPLFAIGGLALAGVPPFGTFVGGSMIEEAAKHAGSAYRVVPVAMTVASIVTGAAVLRACGRIFFGVGAKEEEVENVGGETSEAPETKAPHGRVPAVMIATAAALLALGCAVGVAAALPRVRDGVTAQAERMRDTAGYAAVVLDGAPARSAARGGDGLRLGEAAVKDAVVAAAALALAAGVLGRKRLPAGVRRPLRRAVEATLGGMRRLHTGRIGDYVAWLTFGFAAAAVSCLVLLR